MMTPWSQAGPRRGANSTSNQEQRILTGPFREKMSQKLTKEETEPTKEETELTKEKTEQGTLYPMLDWTPRSERQPPSY